MLCRYHVLQYNNIERPPLEIDVVLSSGLVMLSQLARSSDKYYGLLGAATTLGDVRNLLLHPFPAIRSRACNLLGNMCKHSDVFYRKFACGVSPAHRQPAYLYQNSSSETIDDGRCDVIFRLVARCGDSDDDTRKFACFAVGNSSFYSGFLYAKLAISVPILVSLLSDEGAKTRANAAGALGNLVRNSGVLCKHLVLHRAPHELLRLAVHHNAAGAREGQIALFSLGSLCVYDSCRGALTKLKPSLKPQLETFISTCENELSRKYAVRILRKAGIAC